LYLALQAVVHYAGLLESSATRDRQCAVIALGFLSATECIEQLAYLCHGDPEADVREASSNVLLSFGKSEITLKKVVWGLCFFRGCA